MYIMMKYGIQETSVALFLKWNYTELKAKRTKI